MAGALRVRRTNAAAAPSLPNLTVNIQTSVQGRPRPIGWGTGIVSGNILDLQDFRPVPVISNSSSPAGGAGKGGAFRGSTPTPTYSWTYYATVIIGLCDGPITSVNRFTGDGITLGTFPSGAAGGTVFIGSQTQTPWSYMATAHPPNALSYRGHAYIAFDPMFLGSNSTVPSFQFEVTFGIAGAGPDFPRDANARDVVTDFLTNPHKGVPGWPSDVLGNLSSFANYTQALGLVISPVLADQTDGHSFLGSIMRGTNSEIVCSNGLLNIVPYGDTALSDHGAVFTPDNTPVYALTVDDLLPLQGGGGAASGGATSPIGLTRRSAQDLFNSVTVEWKNRANAYIEEPVEHQDEASISATRERPADVRSMHFFCLAEAASMSASLQLTREQTRCKYYFTLPRSFILLDPMDLVSLPLDRLRPSLAETLQVVRIKEITENADRTLTFTAEEFNGVATAPLYARQGISHVVPDFNEDPGPIRTPVFFEPPFNMGELAVFAGICGTNPELWGGANVCISFDGTNYVLIEQIKGASRMGVLTATLPSIAASGPPTIDNTNTLHVDLSESLGSLTSASAADMNAGSTACWLADTGEIVAFQNATLTGANAYALAPLQRGAFGTPIGSHPSGTSLVRIDGTAARIPYDASRVGETVFVKFVSFNVYGGGLQDIADVPAYSYVIQGAALDSQYHYTPESTSVIDTDHVLTVSPSGRGRRSPPSQLATLLAAEGAIAAALGTLNSAVAAANSAIAAANTAIADANSTIAANATTAHSEATAALNQANTLFATAETDIGAVNTTINTEILNRKTGDTQVAVKIDNVAAASPNTDWSDYNDFFQAIRAGGAATAAARAGNTAGIAYAGVQTLQTALLSTGLAFASLSTTVAAQISDVQAYVQSEALARVAGDQANATLITAVKATSDANSAAITVLQTTVVDPLHSFGALTETVEAQTALGDDYAAADNFFATIQTGRADRINALAANQAIAGVQRTSSALTDLTQAVASYSLTVGAQFGNAFAAINENATALATANGSIASLSTTVTTQGASISTNATAISNAQGDIATLQTNIGTANARISTVETTQTSQGTTLASVQTTVSSQGGSITSLSGTVTSQGSTISGLQSTVSAQGTSISNNATAISNAQGDIGSLQTTVNAQGVTISSNSTAISNIHGVLIGRYSLDINNSGKVVGFSILNDASSPTSFDVVADTFNVWASGYSNQPVFSVGTINGVAQVTINGTKVGDLSLLNNGLGNNSVSHNASATGASGSTGNASLNVRAGDDVLILAFTRTQFSTTDGITTVSGVPNGPRIDITLNTGGGPSVVASFPTPFLSIGAPWLFTCGMAAYSAIAGSAGTWTASAAAAFGDASTGNPNQPIPVPITIKMSAISK